jgi:type I restriction enzyme, S subunit
MSNYTISSQTDKNKVFILQKSELEKRLDPQFYKQEYKDNLERIKRHKHKRLGDIVKFSSETWNQKDYFINTFPYIEISEIDTISGEIQNIVQVEIKNAASRAKMVVRANDIIISTTRPNRGAIALINNEQDFSIASTGFSVIRNITSHEVCREYLFAILRQQIILKQFEQRSSGGNYPAITQEELSNVTIPLPDLEKQSKIISIFNNCFDQKKQNESQAEKLLSSIDDYLLKELGITLPTPPENTLKNRIFVSFLKDISGNRFDPKYYSLKYINLKLALSNSKYKFLTIKSFLSDISMGISTPEYKSESLDVPFILGKNLKKGFLDLANLEYISNETNNANKSSIIKENDILFSVRGVYIGKVAVVPKEIEGANIINNIVKFSLNNINSHYVVGYLNSSIGQEFIYREVWGGAQPGFTNEQIKSFPIPIPPLAKQKEIADHITSIRQQAQKLKDKTKEALAQANKEIEKILLG